MAIDDHAVLRRHGVSAVLPLLSGTLICNRCNLLFAQFKTSGCGGISHDQRVQGGTGVDVDPTENGIPPHLPLWVQVPRSARNTLHRGGSEQHHAEADPPGLLSIIEAIKPPGSNWTPKPLRTRVDD